MTYQAAVEASNPRMAELYKIVKLDTTEEYYTSWYRNIVYDSHTYQRIAIMRDPVRYQTGIKIGLLSARVPIDDSYITIADVVGRHIYDGAELYLTQIDMSNTTNNRCLFRGTVSVINLVENAMNVNFENVMAKLRAILPLRSYTQQCTHRFGDPKCTAVLADLKESSSTDAGSSATVLIDSSRTEADNYWRYGYVHLLSGDLSGEMRTVIASDQSSTNFTVEEPFSAAVGAGISYDLYPFCRKKLDRCFTDKYLGFWFIKKAENVYYG